MRHLLAFACLTLPALAETQAPPKVPQVLFIAVDDLNDWVGPLGGHPLVRTPHLDRLAACGTTFRNAHCNAPLCNPSRASLLLGLRPSTTGIYGLEPSFRRVPEWKDRVTLPQHFARHGYRTAAAGKIFHWGSGRPAKGQAPADQEPEFHDFGPPGGVGVRPPRKRIPPTPQGDHPLMDWGVWPTTDDDSGKGDTHVADWAVQKLQEPSGGSPRFLAAGFFLPHVPCYASPRWFELYPDDDSVLPRVWDRDRDDTPRFSWYLHWSLPEPRLSWLRSSGQWRNLSRSYLACVSFVDAQIGRVLDALDRSGQADSTWVVVWGDHGWHLGEKGITGKNTLWERSTRVPLIFAGPGIARGAVCDEPAELLDVYPTLVELAGLPPRSDLDGRSLVPQLRDARAPREHPALTTHNPGNHGVRSRHWRYIRYADGSEELYDLRTDPLEWHNLAGRTEHAAVIAEHRRWLPAREQPPVAGSAHRVLTYDAAGDVATWEGKPVRREDPIPD
jgi:arylsulfatase A-like enzyme